MTLWLSRRWLIGICKCGHTYGIHKNFHKTEITVCGTYRCKCKRYRLRRVRYL